MKRYLKISAALVAASMTVACQEQATGPETPETPETPGSGKEIILSTSISGPEVKAAFPQTDTQLAEGLQVSLWVDESGQTATPLYENNILTSNGEGGLYGGETMYYPTSGNPVNVYALKTNAALASDSYPSGRLLHSVRADQRELSGFADSDLLYAAVTGVTDDTDVVSLLFRHLLSKVQVAVTLSEGLVKEDIAGLEINGTKLQAGFTLDKALSPAEVEIVSDGNGSAIEIGSDISDSFDAPSYNDAVIVPQSVTGGTPFIVVRLSDGTRLAYRLPEAAVFESGTAYQYHIRVNRDGLAVTTGVTDWLPGGLVEGTADVVL